MPRFDIVLAKRRVGTWVVMSRIGAIAGAACFVMASQERIPLFVIAGIVAANLGTFFVLQAVARTWRNGRYVLLEHVVAAAGATIVIALSAQVDVDTVMAAWLPSISVTLACGRLGCLMSGCCRGQVASWGVRYSWQLPWIAGGAWGELRAIPVQAFEALLLLALAAFGFAARDPELVVATVPTVYAVARIEFDFRIRGDRRRQIGPLSHNQWWCAAILITTTIGAPSPIGVFACVAVALGAYPTWAAQAAS